MKTRILSLFFCFALVAVIFTETAGASDSHRLFYRTPAPDSIEGWERQSLPLGCGHFGVSVFGDAQHERLQITHNAVLTGRGHHEFGNLTSALDLRIDFDGVSSADYARGLDLEKGLAWVSFGTKENRIRREYFTSYPARVLAMRFTSTKRGALTFRVRPEIPYLTPFGAKGEDGVIGRQGQIVAKDASIAVDEHFDYFGVKFAARMIVVPEGGTLTSDASSVLVSNADAAVVYFACDTNYRLSPHTFVAPRTEKLDPKDEPGPRATALVAAAKAKGWMALKSEHEKDMEGLLGRASIDLAADEKDALVPTDELLGNYAKGKRSRYLEETYWQYGRYLLVASSRPGTLPANLQGVWTAHKISPWGSGYWHNINVQMNYWPAFNSNLAECFQAYADFNAAFRPTTRDLAIQYLKKHKLGPIPSDGEADDMWCIGTAMYPYVICGGPGGHSGPGTGGLTTKVFADWYDFTQDRAALEKYVWPIVHGMADFLTRCVAETNGVYLSAFSASPEQIDTPGGTWDWRKGSPPYYTTVGCAFDQQMIWENNHDLLRFAEILGKDDAVVRLVRKQIDRYDPVQIGASGQIKEFREENKYGEIGEKQHRHISQLCGLMPGTLITQKTPEWMAAAKKTLDFRGDRSTGWALAHRLNARARTGEGDRAYTLLNNLLSERTYANLWDAHPPFQIDGNFGATAGITEMLIQSHVDGIDLLPALPKAWSKKGSFRGLCARGAYEVDCEWRDGVPVKVEVRSLKGLPMPEIRFNGKPISQATPSVRFVSNSKVKVFPAGVHYFEATKVFAAADSGTVWKAAPGAKVVLSGARRVTGWKKGADGLWVAEVPWVTGRENGFRQLTVNGELRPRAKHPNKDYFTSLDFPHPEVKDWGAWEYRHLKPRFRIKPGEIDPKWHLAKGEIIFYHIWNDSHCPPASLTVENGTNWVNLATPVRRNPCNSLWRLENLKEIADEPGEWALDYDAKRIYYRPMNGEDPSTAEIAVPFLDTLVRLDGAKDVRFEGLTFADSRYELARGDRNDLQASHRVTAAVVLTNAQDCVFERCTFTHLSGYALDFQAGTCGSKVSRCTLTTLGAGGVRLNGPGYVFRDMAETNAYAQSEMPDPRFAVRDNEIVDCEIADYGRDFASAVGVLAMHAEGTKICHNEIHDGYYTGVSVGWNWGYQPSVARDNVVEYNHIYNIGKGLISDMGGVYLLGVAPGTKVCHNLIHDVDARYYGGWGIYPDEGSTGLLIEDNVVYGTKFAPFHQHFGRNNTVRNNIFAGGKVDQLARSTREDHTSFFFYNNIVWWEEGKLHSAFWHDDAPYNFVCTAGSGRPLKIRRFLKTTECDYNLYFNPTKKLEEVKWGTQECSWDDWREKFLQDRHSVWADPLFVDAKNRDYRLKPDSPALKLGFRPIDVSQVGPR